jgi:hypothetical protein
MKSSLVMAPLIHGYLGKLGLKEEAAGKVRVFAMVDCWTQWVLQPLHRKLFGVLARQPMDGTFNQLGPLKRVPFGKVPIYSFDLSSATDRLPIEIQKWIISEVYGKKFSDHWASLLVGREYQVPKLPDSVLSSGIIPRAVRYAVGQPMGALSSWAMLAMTHHFIVQSAAWMAGLPKGKFTQYAVLGDDIIIWNRPVAKAYLRILSALGVEVGLAKSIISLKGKGLEFAKKTFLKGQDVSPVPFKEQSSAHRNFALMRNFCEKYNLTLLKALRFLGYGYKVGPDKNSRVVRLIKLALAIPRTYEDLILNFHDSPMLFGLDPSQRREVGHFLNLLWHSEVLDTLKRCRKIWSDILQYIVGLSVDEAQVFQHLMLCQSKDISQRHIKELEGIISELKWLSSHGFDKDLSGFIGKYPHMWDTTNETSHMVEQQEWYWDGSPLTNFHIVERTPYPWYELAPVVAKWKILFSIYHKLDKIQVKSIISPSILSSESLSFMEEKRTLQLWDKWNRLLKDRPLQFSHDSRLINR